MDTPENPLDLFRDWYALAREREPGLPDAVSLATATADGVPSVRMLLFKGVDERGFSLYTNLGSRKAHEMDENPHAALCFHWKSLARQVRVEGAVAPLPDEEADAYFASRDRSSQLGAWASTQSRPLADRATLEDRLAEVEARFGDGPVPRPDFWSGFRLAPVRIEFWEERPARLHDRIEYRRDGDGWTITRLYP
jgi:pyridoxamine 5'-phosphate oxidase